MIFEEQLAKIYRLITGNHGIIKDKEDPRNHEHLGFFSAPKKVLFKTIDEIRRALPLGEQQNKFGEKMNCVTQTALNELETQTNRMIKLEEEKKADEEQLELLKIFRYFKMIKNGKANFSKRYIAKASNTSWRGNNYTNVWDAIRNAGLLAEDEYPDVQGWNEYYKPLSQEMQDKAKKIYQFIEVIYERVREQNYEDVVKYSGGVQGAINAPGRRNANGVYFPTGGNNHSVMFFNKKIVSREYFDSYPPYQKEYTISHKFGRGVIGFFKLKEKFSPFNQVEIDKLRDRGLKYLLRSEKDGEVWTLKKDGMEYIGKIENAKDFNEDAVRAMSKIGELTGISEADFSRLHI